MADNNEIDPASANPKWRTLGGWYRRANGSCGYRLSLSVYLLSFPTHSPSYVAAHIVFILYYTRLFQRMLTIQFAAENTIRLLHTSAESDCTKARQSDVAPQI